jgi:hypothetical protein
MTAHKKRIRVLRSMLLAGCVAALALPAGAGAMPLGPHPVSATRLVVVAPDESGARLDHRGLNGAGAQAYVLPSSLKTDVQSAPYSSPSSSAPATSVVRDIQTVTTDTNHTLAILLASCALGIALCGTGYVALRLTRLQRRVG